MNHPGPPKKITNLLEWFCPDHLFEGIVGDLEEQFYCDLKAAGEKKAKRRYIWNTIMFIRPGIILRNKFEGNLINTIMFFNHIKIGIRSILRRKFFSFINAFGLSIGVAFSVLIYLFVVDENNFDQFHSNKDKIFRIHENSNRYEPDQYGNTLFKFPWLQTGLAPVLKEEVPEVKYATGFNSGEDATFKSGDKVFTEYITFVHQDFFKMFDFKTLQGDYDQFLSDPSQIVLTESTANKYFGNEDSVGKEITLTIFNSSKSYIVAGVIEDTPANSSLDYQSALIRAENRPFYDRNLDNWRSWNTPTFVMLQDPSQQAHLERSLDEIYSKYVQTQIDREVEESGDQPIGEASYGTMPLTEIHLATEIGWTRVSDPQYSLILSGIAVLILIIACINYVALAMTNASGKNLEVSIRKAMGGIRKQLISQLMIESLLLASVAMLFSVILIVTFLPYFNEFTNKSISISGNWWRLGLSIISFTLLVGFLAGAYPSIIISAFKPASMLKSRQSSKVKANVTWPLVVLQFAISAFLIICSVVMFKQMNFITTKDLGYNQDQILVIPTYTGWSDQGEQLMDRFKIETTSNLNIINVGGTSASFAQGWSQNGFRVNGEVHRAYNYRVDPNYIETLNIKIKEGRNFDDDIASDHRKTLIVNEALVNDMGWDNPLNQMLYWQGDSLGGWKIIGVVEDYHFLSLEKQIEPLFMHMDGQEGKITTLLIKISPDDIPNTIKYLQNKWNELAGEKPFDYNFLDEDVAQQYESYQKWSSIMWLSTLFAILVACLGLFGLAGINTLNRTKEIGIRKALGAEMEDILVMMNKPFVLMAMISFTLAIPASWWIMNQWLSDFQYAISLGWQLFAVSLVAALLFAMLTVSYHSFKAAWVNPADTLKYE